MKIRGENGITLLALIITVILLVILATVTINAVFDSGIIWQASNGTQNYVSAEKTENEIIGNTASIMQEYINGTYSGGSTSGGSSGGSSSGGTGETESDTITASISATACTENTITVKATAQDSETEIASYKFEISEYSDFSEILESSTTATTDASCEYTFSNLTSNTTYYMRVKVTNSNNGTKTVSCTEKIYEWLQYYIVTTTGYVITEEDTDSYINTMVASVTKGTIASATAGTYYCYSVDFMAIPILCLFTSTQNVASNSCTYVATGGYRNCLSINCGIAQAVTAANSEIVGLITEYGFYNYSVNCTSPTTTCTVYRINSDYVCFATSSDCCLAYAQYPVNHIWYISDYGTINSQGTATGSSVYALSSTAYPSNNEQDDYWYILQ